MDGGGPAGPWPESDGDAETLVREFRRWALEERDRSVAAERPRERWLRQQATEAATLAGVFLDLAEGGTPVVLSTAARQRSGQVVGVARDFVVVEGRDKRATLVALAAVAVVRPMERHGPAAGDRRAPIELDLASALEALAGERSPVTLEVADGSLLHGDLVALGADVATLRLEGGSGSVAYVPLAAISACTAR